MDEKREIPLGELLKDAFFLQDEKNRLQKMELLLVAIEFMSVCAERIISEETAEKFDTLFDMVQDIKSSEGTERHEELLEDEMDFSWDDYQSWVLSLLLEDSYLKKNTGFRNDWTRYLNKFTVPYFFLENYLELYMTPTYYFPLTGQLYYIHRERDVEEYSDWDEEDWWEHPEDEYYIQTLRVLDLGKEHGKLYESCEGEILYYGPWMMHYVKRNHSFCLEFRDVDWCVYYSLETNKIEHIAYHRHLIGVTPQGEEVVLRDSIDGSKLEICHIHDDGEEKFVTNHLPGHWFRDGYIYTKKPFERAHVCRTYKIHMNGRKTYCSDLEWRKAIWIWMLDGIEPESRNHFSCGGGLIRSILRAQETLSPPVHFSCEEIRKRLWWFRNESKKNKRRTGRILASLALLEHMGVKKDDDLFEFWEQTALYWMNMRGRFNIASKEFVKFLEKEAKEKNFVRKVCFAPSLLYMEYKRLKANRKDLCRSCNSLLEYFGTYMLQSTFIGEFGPVNGGLYCDKAYLNEGDLRDGKVYMGGNAEKKLSGKVYFDFAGNRHIIQWPKGLDIRRLEDVLERFGIEERWKIVFEK